MFGLLIAVHQRREFVLRLALHARRQYIQYPVIQRNRAFFLAQILQGRSTYPAVFAGRRPEIREAQTQRVVLFAEHDRIPYGRFSYLTRDVIDRLLSVRERLPIVDNCTRTCKLITLSNFIVRIVREQCLVRTPATGCQTTCRRQIHP